mmetsp:Transcript_59296/g.129869  ORF Transcript_59296/g.129869 Transcript_59296/m.129869 type:complete len:313 (-) Transcript_59296:175-1113(-)
MTAAAAGPNQISLPRGRAETFSSIEWAQLAVGTLLVASLRVRWPRAGAIRVVASGAIHSTPLHADTAVGHSRRNNRLTIRPRALMPLTAHTISVELTHNIVVVLQLGQSVARPTWFAFRIGLADHFALRFWTFTFLRLFAIPLTFWRSAGVVAQSVHARAALNGTPLGSRALRLTLGISALLTLSADRGFSFRRANHRALLLGCASDATVIEIGLLAPRLAHWLIASGLTSLVAIRGSTRPSALRHAPFSHGLRCTNFQHGHLSGSPSASRDKIRYIAAHRVEILDLVVTHGKWNPKILRPHIGYNFRLAKR